MHVCSPYLRFFEEAEAVWLSCVKVRMSTLTSCAGVERDNIVESFFAS